MPRLNSALRVALDFLAEAVLCDLDLACDPLQEIFAGGLKPIQTLLFGANRAYELGCKRPLRIDAARVGNDPNALNPKLADTLGGHQVDVTSHIGKAGLAIGDRVQDLSWGAVKRLCQPLRCRDRVIQEVRGGEDGRRGRELATAAIVD